MQCGKDITGNLPLALNSSSTDSTSKDDVCFVIPRNSPVRTRSRRSNSGCVISTSGSVDGTSSLWSGDSSGGLKNNCSSLGKCIDKTSGHLPHSAESQRGLMNITAGNNHHLTHQNSSMTNQSRSSEASLLVEELRASTDYIFQSKLTWLVLVGPVAIVGDWLGLLSEATCFALSGIALIPCAER